MISRYEKFDNLQLKTSLALVETCKFIQADKFIFPAFYIHDNIELKTP